MNKSHASELSIPATRQRIWMRRAPLFHFFYYLVFLFGIFMMMIMIFFSLSFSVRSIKRKWKREREKKYDYRQISWLGRRRWPTEKKRRLAPPARTAAGWRRSAGSPWPRCNMSVAMIPPLRCRFSIRKTATDDFLQANNRRKRKKLAKKWQKIKRKWP